MSFLLFFFFFHPSIQLFLVCPAIHPSSFHPSLYNDCLFLSCCSFFFTRYFSSLFYLYLPSILSFISLFLPSFFSSCHFFPSFIPSLHPEILMCSKFFNISLYFHLSHNFTCLQKLVYQSVPDCLDDSVMYVYNKSVHCFLCT